MADTLEKADNASEEEYSKPNPQVNPRNISLNEIAGKVAEGHKTDFAETAPVIDDDHQPVGAPPAVEDETPAPEVAEEEAGHDAELAPATEPVKASPSQEPIDPAKEYEVTIDGQKMKVPGQKIIDAGFRTFQKETAADYRLKTATDLLRQAEEQARATTHASVIQQPPVQVAEELSDTDLANAIQYGSPEQASRAIAEMRKRDKVDPAQIVQMAAAQARNEVAFQEGLKFVQAEYPDLLANDHVKRLFFVEENRRRASKQQGGEGDTRPHKELYQAIGDELRKSLNMPKPATGTTQSTPTVASTAASRQERKAAVPSVPRTAAGRLSAASDAPKVKTTSEIIAAMAAKRGQGNLNRNLNKE